MILYYSGVFLFLPGSSVSLSPFVCVCLCMCVCVHAHVCVCVCMHAHVCVCVHICLYICVCAVVAHNKDPSKEPISSVLCPGLGTAVGRMPFKRAAVQVCACYLSCFA